MTDRLGLTPLVQDAEKNYVRWNETLAVLDALTGARVLSRTTTTTPAGAIGAVYLVPDSGVTGDWTGNEGNLAYYYNGWRYQAPVRGLSAWVADEDQEIVYSGSTWVAQDEIVVLDFSLESFSGASDHELCYTEGDWSIIDARSVLTVASGTPSIDWSVEAYPNRSFSPPVTTSVFGVQQTISQTLGDPHGPIANPANDEYVWLKIYGTSAVTIDNFNLTIRYTYS